MTLDSTQDLTANRPDSLSDLELRAGIEAVLMITDAPVSLVALATALEQPVNVIREAVLALRDDYDGAASGSPRGFELREVGGGWRIFVRQEFDWAVKLFVANENPTKLSQAALETLAVEHETHVTNVGAFVQTGEHLLRVGHLRNLLGIHEAGHFESTQSCVNQAFDEFDFGGRRHDAGLALQSIAWANFHDFDRARHRTSMLSSSPIILTLLPAPCVRVDTFLTGQSSLGTNPGAFVLTRTFRQPRYYRP